MRKLFTLLMRYFVWMTIQPVQPIHLSYRCEYIRQKTILMRRKQMFPGCFCVFCVAAMRQTNCLKGSQVPFDECAVGGNDGWGAEINQIAGHPSG